MRITILNKKIFKYSFNVKIVLAAADHHISAKTKIANIFLRVIVFNKELLKEIFKIIKIKKIVQKKNLKNSFNHIIIMFNNWITKKTFNYEVENILLFIN